LKKKILYLDQFVVSEIMKLRTADAKGHQAVAAEPFWAELAALLEKLGRLQLICCPDSGEHQNESLLSPFYQALNRPTSRSPEASHFIQAAKSSGSKSPCFAPQKERPQICQNTVDCEFVTR
jgi:hypothetical protein